MNVFALNLVPCYNNVNSINCFAVYARGGCAILVPKKATNSDGGKGDGYGVEINGTYAQALYAQVDQEKEAERDHSHGYL